MTPKIYFLSCVVVSFRVIYLFIPEISNSYFMCTCGNFAPLGLNLSYIQSSRFIKD